MPRQGIPRFVAGPPLPSPALSCSPPLRRTSLTLASVPIILLLVLSYYDVCSGRKATATTARVCCTRTTSLGYWLPAPYVALYAETRLYEDVGEVSH